MKFSPSHAYIWLRCGLYPSLVEFFPSTSSPAAEEGTRLHSLACEYIKHGVLPENDEDEKAIRLYAEVVENYFQGFGQLFIEEKISILGGCEGTPDAAVLSKDRLSVIDLKTGTQPVKAFENPQLLLYAIGLILKHNLPHAQGADDYPVDLVIVQPRRKYGNPIDVWRTTVATVMSYRERFESAMANAMTEHPKVLTGGHCWYCPCKLHCHEYKFALAYRGTTT